MENTLTLTSALGTRAPAIEAMALRLVEVMESSEDEYVVEAAIDLAQVLQHIRRKDRRDERFMKHMKGA